MRKMRLLCCWVYILLLFSSVYLNAENPCLFFEGFLSKEKLTEHMYKIDELEKNVPKEIILYVNSKTGEIEETIQFANRLSEFRQKHATHIIVYIDDEALGPAAILPFLQDELIVSPSVVWGAIVFRENAAIPVNLLRSRVQGLINPNNPHYDLLKLIANAMIDEKVQIVQKDGWKEGYNEKGENETITRHGETLIINQNQLQALHLASRILSHEEFFKTYVQEQKEPESEPHIQASKVLDFNEILKQYIKIEEGKKPVLGHILIADHNTSISQATWLYVQAALNEYKKTRPPCIILEIDTPGGEVFAAQRISDALKEMDTQFGIPIIAYINNWAISAGAMLAYSCRFIVIAKDASMGAAEPVTMEGGGMQSASEKINSALRTDFANRAQFFDRNPYIAEAMVDKQTILVMRHGSIIKLGSEDEIIKGGIDPDVVISPRGKLLTLSAKQLMEYGVADFMFQPMKSIPLSPEESNKQDVQLADTIFTEIPFFKNIPNGVVNTYKMNWQTEFVSFLSSPIVSSILFLILMVSVYIEISTGGFGVAGTLSVISLFLILLSSFALQAISWLEPLLFFFGLGLCLLEIFVFPTLGILGFIGGIFMIAGIVGMMLPGVESVKFDGGTLNAAGEYVLTRLSFLSLAFLFAIIIILLLSRYVWPKFTFFHRFILKTTPTLDASFQEDYNKKLFELSPQVQVGMKAIVVSALRPAGKIRIGDSDFDAISTGNFLSEGTKVQIVDIEGAKIFVQEEFSSKDAT